MARDALIVLNRCYYCGRPGAVLWEVDLLTCRSDVCTALADSEIRRRRRNHVGCLSATAAAAAAVRGDRAA